MVIFFDVAPTGLVRGVGRTGFFLRRIVRGGSQNLGAAGIAGLS